jgi:RNA polymerase-binding transcription factor DksA
LNKIGKGKFGVCEKCGEGINEARLKVLPTARFCLNCEGKSRN